MKEYATLKTRSVEHSEYVTFSSRKYHSEYMSLDQLLKDGWEVTASGVNPGTCARPEVEYVFILERNETITE